jgi:hypothetical protein
MCTGMRMVRTGRRGAGDGLANPPGGVGREFVALGVVEFVDGLKEAEVAFLDEVEKRQIRRAVYVFLGDRNDEAEVGAGKNAARFFVAFDDALREIFF